LAAMNELNRAIGELTAEVRGLRRDVQDDRAASADYRQGIRDELGKIVIRQTYLETDVTSIRAKVDDMEQVTVQVKTMTMRAEGAGTLGRWLIRIGIGVVTCAGWIIGAYTYLTGKPPP
jgi:hypothetical protein